jgi:hypothetical protein
MGNRIGVHDDAAGEVRRKNPAPAPLSRIAKPFFTPLEVERVVEIERLAPKPLDRVGRMREL